MPVYDAAVQAALEAKLKTEQLLAAEAERTKVFFTCTLQFAA